MNDYHEQNRRSWNAATQRHHSHKPDLVERYAQGYNNLYREDMDLLGDLTGKRVVHLQCNDGQDTLSIAKHLNGDVTGIDISDYAIDFARQFSEETGIPATFIRSDIFDWFENNDTRFDVIYTSYGAINWVSNLDAWAQGIIKTLAPGGKFVMIEFHSLAKIFDPDWTLTYDYMSGHIEDSFGVGDYVADDYDCEFNNPHHAYEFAWGVGDVVTALLDAGLTLTHLREYPYSNGWKMFREMRTDEDNRHYPPDDKPELALMYSVVATKSA